MNKNNLLKLKNTKHKLQNPLSSILCCKSYIFHNQFNTTETTNKIDKLDKSIFTRPELTTYEPDKTEDILLWFQTDKCKKPMDKLIIEHFELNTKYEWLKMINENRFIQNIIYYSNLVINPLVSISFICLIMSILLYYLFTQTYNIRFPLNSFVNILKNSILLKNNLPKLILSRIEQAKYILYTGSSMILIHLGLHLYNTHTLLDETQILYDKIKEFKQQIQYMRNITERLCNIQNDTLDYFMNILNDGFYERGEYNLKCFLIMNRGRIISDYFKIANKKNKLGKLFKLNGMCSYMKIIEMM